MRRLALLAILALLGSGAIACTDRLPGVATATPAGSPAASPANTSGRPNIIFVLTDDETASDFAFMPNVQNLLVGQGMSLPNFFVTVSLCCPSRSTILRGQYVHNHGVLTNSDPNGGYKQFMARGDESSTVATWLHDAGYRTALLGKYLNGYPDGQDRTHVPPGWDEWDSPIGIGGYSEYNYQLNENGKLVSYGFTPNDYLVDVMAKKATGFIEGSATSGSPFFLYLAPFAPHQPATPAPRHLQLFKDATAPRTPAYNEADVSDKPAYVRNRNAVTTGAGEQIDALYRKRLQSLQSVDEMVAGLVKTLTDTGQLDNTYIFLTSDNGFMQGQHRILMGKQVPYEESIRVSMVARGPGIPAGQARDYLAGNVDLAPTFAAIAGAKVPDFVDGRSLLPLLGASPPSADRWRTAYLIEHWLPQSDQEGDLIQLPEFHGVRTSEAAYVEYVTGERELYDLRSDPNELQNLAARADPAVLKAFADLVASLKTCSRDSCRSAEEATPPRLNR